MMKPENDIQLNPPLNKKKSFWVRFNEEKYLQFMALCGVVWMLIFNYTPMYGILIAFKKDFKITSDLFTWKLLGGEKPYQWAAEYGFHHFIRFFQDEEFANVMLNTLGISLLKLAINFPLPIVFALMLNEIRGAKFKKAVQTISYLPHFLSWVVLGGILTTWLGDGGLFNEILLKLGLIEESKTWLGYPQYFWPILIISDLWKELGWSAIIYLAAISGIDQEMYEAAKVDGASRWKQIWAITLPSISGTITILFILAVGGLLNSNFDQIFVLYNPLNLPRANTIDLYVYITGMRGSHFSYATAIGLFKSVIAFILLFIANQVTKRLNDTALF